MADLEHQIQMNHTKMRELNGCRGELEKRELQTEEGKKAKTDAITQINGEVDTLTGDNRKLHAELEVATVEMLTGKDTDFAEPTPADALKNAS
jgi:hypothetical protein